MIRWNILLFVLIVFIERSALATSIPLADAVKQKKISVEARKYIPPTDGNYHAGYFNRCMELEVKNLTSTNMIVTENAGRFLMPADSNTQRMMMTADVTITLKAGEKRIVPVFSMCTEAGDGAPLGDDRFSYGSLATGELKQLVSFIAAKGYQNEAAQSAVWTITDNYSPYSIYDNDTVVMNGLRRIVCTLKKLTYDPSNDRVIDNTPLVRYIKGSFTFSIYKEEKVDLVIFTDDHKLIKDVLQNQSYSAGTHTVAYEASVPVIDPTKSQSVILMFYLDGKLFTNKKHVLQPWR